MGRNVSGVVTVRDVTSSSLATAAERAAVSSMSVIGESPSRWRPHAPSLAAQCALTGGLSNRFILFIKDLHYMKGKCKLPCNYLACHAPHTAETPATPILCGASSLAFGASQRAKWLAMAIMTSCPRCGAMISPTANACRRCGVAFKRFAVVPIGLAIMLAIALLYVLLQRYLGWLS